eukprot:CCRYP_014842-RA/>CCRYP_014842-RA protein AED:0.00 eAED:0.00 QI:132/1/1/1/0/0/2/2/51
MIVLSCIMQEGIRDKIVHHRTVLSDTITLLSTLVALSWSPPPVSLLAHSVP